MRRHASLFFLSTVAALCGAAAPARAQVVGGTAVGVSLTTSTLSSGSVLSVQPAVSADGRYVTMSVQPTYASFDGFDTFSSGGITSQQTAAGVRSLPFRPAVIGKVTLVENDKTLLTKNVKAATLKDTSLKAAARKLADAADTNVVLGIRGLESAGVDVNAPRTFVIKGGTLKQALLDMLEATIPGQDMVITADDGVVQVVTQAQADNTVVTRSYYLDDVLANLPRVVPNTMDLGTMKDDAAADKPAAAKDAKGGRSGAAANATARKPAAPNGARGAARDNATDVLRLITASVRPEIWKINGGKIGEISLVGDRVYVTAPQSVHAILDGPKHAKRNANPMYIGVSQ
jgi:hypothetical protein